jgi:hypothetical protein
MPQNPGLLEWLQPLLFLVLVGFTVFLVVKQSRDLRRLEEKASSRKRYVTVIDCGGSRVEREFREGDHVGARVPECGGREGVIAAIYVEEVKGGSRGEVKSPGGSGSVSRGG